MLLAYNLMFVVPSLVLLATHQRFRCRLQHRFNKYQATLRKGARDTFLFSDKQPERFVPRVGYTNAVGSKEGT